MHALIVVNDLSPSDLIKLANTATKTYGTISLLYVKPNLPSCYYRLPSMIDIDYHNKLEGKATLRFVGNMLNIPNKHQWCATGHIKNQTKYLAKSVNADIILASEKTFNQLTSTKRKLQNLACAIGKIPDLVENRKTKSNSMMIAEHVVA